MSNLQQGVSDGLQGKTKEELIDYVRQTEKCLDEIREICKGEIDGAVGRGPSLLAIEDIYGILNRRKSD